LDKIDAKLIMLLQENSRITISELSKKLALSRPSIQERMFKLQEKKIVQEYTARISLPAIGRDMLLFIQLGFLKQSASVVEELIVNDPDILECHRITGQADYIIKAAVCDMDGMRKLLDRLMPLGDVNTAISILSLVPYRHITIHPEETP
jgi:Lrp/AsnC family transcriptional regulator, leucine-responsive regulatory protein